MSRVVSFLSILLLAPAASAAEPAVRAVNVRGLQPGAPTTITIDGDDFGKAPKLLLPFAAKQALADKNTEKQVVFTVTPDAAVPPGLYHLRVVTDGGVSLPTVIAVDALPQRSFGPDAGALPVALHGAVGESQVLETTFAGTAGQKVLVEVEAQRLGGKLRPVAHLYTAKRLQLAWSWGVPDLLGDTRLEATLPESGTYTVTLHDAEYAAGNPGFFRLKIGTWQAGDLVFPPVAGADTTAVELIGVGAPVKIDLPAKRTPGPIAWPAGAWSGPRPVLEISPRAERVVEPAGDTPVELPGGPVGVAARFAAPFAEHRYKVPIEPKTKVRFEVFAERHRFPLDAALVVRDEKGTQLARAEDGPGTLDPVLEYAVPDKTTSVIVGVVETQGRAGPRAAYRLTVDRVGEAKAGDFKLFTPAQRLSLPAGGRGVIPVFADRRGYAGPITLAPSGLPAGWSATGTTIPPDADGALVTLTRSDAAADATVTTWTGRGADGTERPLTVKGHALERLQPWLAAEFAAAPVAGKAEVAIDWNALPDTAALAPPFKLKLPVRVTRPDPAAPVRLTLLTSQNPPLQNNQPDAAKAIRAEKAVELAAKAADAEFVALVPPALPADGYDLAVLVEVLSADKQRVLATAVTPVRRFPVRLPVAVTLDGGPAVGATLDAKAATAIELKGEVTRAEGFAGEAVVALAGLPPGAAAPPVTLKAGETRFALKLTLPANTPPGELRGLKLSASAAPDPAQAAVRVKSRDTDIVLTLRPGAKTP